MSSSQSQEDQSVESDIDTDYTDSTGTTEHLEGLDRYIRFFKVAWIHDPDFYQELLFLVLSRKAEYCERKGIEYISPFARRHISEGDDSQQEGQEGIFEVIRRPSKITPEERLKRTEKWLKKGRLIRHTQLRENIQNQKKHFDSEVKLKRRQFEQRRESLNIQQKELLEIGEEHDREYREYKIQKKKKGWFQELDTRRSHLEIQQYRLKIDERDLREDQQELDGQINKFEVEHNNRIQDLKNSLHNIRNNNQNSRPINLKDKAIDTEGDVGITNQQSNQNKNKKREITNIDQNVVQGLEGENSSKKVKHR